MSLMTMTTTQVEDSRSCFPVFLSGSVGRNKVRFYTSKLKAIYKIRIVVFTAQVYIQMEHGWGFAFGALAISMGISNMVFFLGTPLYKHKLPGGSPLTRVAQVLIVAFRKRNASFDISEYIGLYELQGTRSAIKGSGKIAHTDGLSGRSKNHVIAIPTCTIMLCVILTEYLTLSVQQAYTLNTHLGHLKLPVTCMPVFPGLSIFVLLALYYTVFVPLSRRITGHPCWAGFFERYRRNYAIREGYEGSFLSAMPGLSAYWLLIQYCLIGLAEVFCIVGFWLPAQNRQSGEIPRLVYWNERLRSNNLVGELSSDICQLKRACGISVDKIPEGLHFLAYVILLTSMPPATATLLLMHRLDYSNSHVVYSLGLELEIYLYT
ncbi:hypothetical protein L6452_19885 [Arctium lappa]|uniref:Uncharacterized protein n=2 Tax=Arctium lappa TaxID=4217 RepID=A0ACB9B9A9_ARCLA|nr:hypothetical protein L6452_19883 [Arctium lappa]KAI3718999.1 hypothetical protein L6452_19885 [Arctium lappa]